MQSAGAGSRVHAQRRSHPTGARGHASFSHRPLYFTFILGLLSFVIALVNVLAIVYDRMVLGADVDGWASILASVWLVGGMILLVLGIFGIYLSKMFLEIKGRPLTIVRNVYSK